MARSRAIHLAGSRNSTRVSCRLVTARGGPFLLKTEMTAGHGGRSGRYDAWREEALILAWIVTTAKAG